MQKQKLNWTSDFGKLTFFADEPLKFRLRTDHASACRLLWHWKSFPMDQDWMSGTARCCDVSSLLVHRKVCSTQPNHKPTCFVWWSAVSNQSRLRIQEWIKTSHSESILILFIQWQSITALRLSRHVIPFLSCFLFHQSPHSLLDDLSKFSFPRYRKSIPISINIPFL